MILARAHAVTIVNGIIPLPLKIVEPKRALAAWRSGNPPPSAREGIRYPADSWTCRPRDA